MIRALRSDQKRAQRVVLAAAGVCALTGAVMQARPELGVFVAAGAVLLALSLDWRRGVIALLVVLPFAGLPVFVAGTPGLAARDLFVVAPLYLAFAWAMLRSDESTLPPLGVALPALALFAAAVVVGIARAPSLAVGVIGAKVWLAYVPMLAIGYHYVRSAGDLERALRVTALVGLVPASIALIEWLFATHTTGDGYVWINDFGPFSKMYGSWFEHVKWSGVAFGPYGHQVVIPRVPSTFTGSTQYYGFALVAFASAMALALRTRTTPWMLCAVLLGLACIASGVRLSYATTPALAALTLWLAGTNVRHAAYATAAVAVIVLAGSALGANPLRVAGMMPAHAYQQLGTASQELAGGLTAAGHGTGWDTNSALRYGDAAERRFVENWYAKASLELGMVGLASIVVAFAAIGVRLAASLRRLDAGARPMAAALLALLGITAVSLFKGPYIDLDPLNVYFWLFAGMLLGLHRAAGADARASEKEAP